MGQGDGAVGNRHVFSKTYGVSIDIMMYQDFEARSGISLIEQPYDVHGSTLVHPSQHMIIRTELCPTERTQILALLLENLAKTCGRVALILFKGFQSYGNPSTDLMTVRACSYNSVCPTPLFLDLWNSCA